jgi:hypothetical protein
MSFLEFETWRVAAGNEQAHDDVIRRWFDYVKEHQADLFAEWKSARYYRQVDRDGNPTGWYIMLFEFRSREGHHAYKERRKHWDGPYTEYKSVDPYPLFEPGTVSTVFWEPQAADKWFEFP